MMNMNNLDFNTGAPGFIEVKSEFIDLTKKGPYSIAYIDVNSLRNQKLNILFNDVLPELGLTMNDVKNYIIVNELPKELPNILPSGKNIPMGELMDMIADIREYTKRINDEKVTIEKIKEKFNFLEIDLTDSEYEELYNYIKTFTNDE